LAALVLRGNRGALDKVDGKVQGRAEAHNSGSKIKSGILTENAGKIGGGSSLAAAVQNVSGVSVFVIEKVLAAR
jgi:hypothetical protein|tara:strand:- start:2295 stop:2516 length:222 start_codon:yes stop_codon:yes gene_type:complete